MLPLQAAILIDAAPTDGRRATRRTLRLEVQAFSAGDATGALIHDLSETGLLIETSAALKVGETFQVELPEIGTTPGRVVWARVRFFGCRFTSRVSRAAVSAALLRSPSETPPKSHPWAIQPRPRSLDYDYPPVETTNQIALFISLLISLALVILFLNPLARFTL